MKFYSETIDQPIKNYMKKELKKFVQKIKSNTDSNRYLYIYISIK
jgi:hypothetical protein